MAIKGADMPVLAMGDFNDEPFNRSLVEYALSSFQAAKVLKARSPRWFNLMWPLLGQRRGTHYFDNFASMLDQFLASRPLLERTAPIRVIRKACASRPFRKMVGRGEYPAPRRFGRRAAAWIARASAITSDLGRAPRALNRTSRDTPAGASTGPARYGQRLRQEGEGVREAAVHALGQPKGADRVRQDRGATPKPLRNVHPPLPQHGFSGRPRCATTIVARP